jgi:hypothetical protein
MLQSMPRGMFARRKDVEAARRGTIVKGGVPDCADEARVLRKEDTDHRVSFVACFKIIEVYSTYITTSRSNFRPIENAWE